MVKAAKCRRETAGTHCVSIGLVHCKRRQIESKHFCVVGRERPPLLASVDSCPEEMAAQQKTACAFGDVIPRIRWPAATLARPASRDAKSLLARGKGGFMRVFLHASSWRTAREDCYGNAFAACPI